MTDTGSSGPAGPDSRPETPPEARTADRESEIKALLGRLRNVEDTQAKSQLFEILFHDLHRQATWSMRGQPADHTLQPTDLLDEAYLKLISSGTLDVEDRRHFLRLVARVMRQILVDHARKRATLKRGGEFSRTSLDSILGAIEAGSGVDLVGLDEALEELGDLDAALVQVVEMRFFMGMSIEEAAENLAIHPDTVLQRWKRARTWLKGRLS